jgi:hypothetical protein
MPDWRPPIERYLRCRAMKLLPRLWANSARLSRHVRNRRHPEPVDFRERHRQWIREHAAGRSFADIGGLFDLAGDVALYAEESGALPVTLADWGHQVFTDFPRKAKERGSTIRFVQGDIEDPITIREIGPHDIVWSIGVIYHSPNPVRQLLNLREITREYLYLGTHTIPEIPGFPQACLYYPYIDRPTADALSSWQPRRDGLIGLGTEFDDRPMMGYANFWWGITPSALEAMLRSARFEVVSMYKHGRYPFFTEVVARPVDKDPLCPPIEWSRLQGESIERGGELLPFETYYEEQRLAAEQPGAPA